MDTTANSTMVGLGPVKQIAFVPRDFNAAVRFWTETIGAGPFYSIEHLPLEDVEYRGRPTAIDQSVALGYWGDLQIELIRQHDSAPSAYREWLDTGREGLHHLCVEVADVGIARAVLTAAGGVLIHEARMAGAAEAAYFEMPGPGPIIEIARLEPRFTRLFNHMRTSARDWDGRDPLRPLPPEDEWNRAAEPLATGEHNDQRR
jgi:catechol 2,3-dioxygenase-like lactoylglutathione lyase family enzyme